MVNDVLNSLRHPLATKTSCDNCGIEKVLFDLKVLLFVQMIVVQTHVLVLLMFVLCYNRYKSRFTLHC